MRNGKVRVILTPLPSVMARRRMQEATKQEFSPTHHIPSGTLAPWEAPDYTYDLADDERHTQELKNG